MKTCNEENIGRLIYLTAQRLGNQAERFLAPYGLTLEQLQLLKQLDCDQGISQRTLGELTDKTPANVTRILDRLEAKHLILRRDDPADRRTTLVLLTPKGTPLLKQMEEVLEEFSIAFLTGINKQDQETASRVLQTIKRNLESIPHSTATEPFP